MSNSTPRPGTSRTKCRTIDGNSRCAHTSASMNKGTIEDQPSERTMAQVIEDDNIETKITVNLYAENEAYNESHLVAVSYNGYVLLAGQVNDEILKNEATKVVRKIKGVRRIYNELEIGPPTSALTRSSERPGRSRARRVPCAPR